MGEGTHVEDPAGTGITAVTVYSLASIHTPAIQPSASGGTAAAEVVWAADASVCAGPTGSPEGPQLAYFNLVLTDGTTVSAAPLVSPASQNLATVTTLARNQCSRGVVLFRVQAGVRPSEVRYAADPAHPFAWTLKTHKTG